jgi:transcriptional regulator with XRE-family HTH domain
VDIATVIRKRLEELGIEQRDLAAAAEVTESYISQLLAGKKMPPAPDRTDLYEKIARLLQLPSQELAKLADTQRREEQKRKVLDPPRPLFQSSASSFSGNVSPPRGNRLPTSSSGSLSANSNASSPKSFSMSRNEWPGKN